MILQAALQHKQEVFKCPPHVLHPSLTLNLLASLTCCASCCASRLHSQRPHPTNNAFSASLSHPVMSCTFASLSSRFSRPRSFGVTHLAPMACCAPLVAPLAFTSQQLHSANNGVLRQQYTAKETKNPRVSYIERLCNTR